jgi:hypothetical protein
MLVCRLNQSICQHEQFYRTYVNLAMFIKLIGFTQSKASPVCLNHAIRQQPSHLDAMCSICAFVLG